MKTKKLVLGILFGGKSCEHEVSVVSAQNIVGNLSRDNYLIYLIGINKDGRMYCFEDIDSFVDADKFVIEDYKLSGEEVCILPNGQRDLFSLEKNDVKEKLDCVFPVLHGPFGEDGTIQGVLKSAMIPFVGSGILGSCIGMDKVVFKSVLRDYGLPVVDYMAFEKEETIEYNLIEDRLGFPCFIKPANMGSSVGVAKANNVNELKEVCDNAFSFDNKILIEKFVDGREIECAVLGNESLEASVCDEIVMTSEFYSYESKYINKSASSCVIPASLDQNIIEEMQLMAKKAYKAIGALGLSRVDFFFTKEGEIFINEINTMPGFTEISMYPKLFDYQGLKYASLIDRLIKLAMQSSERRGSLNTSYFN